MKYQYIYTYSYYKHVSPYFNPVRFGYDNEEGISAVTSIQSYKHPNDPFSIPDEVLSIDTNYQRTGFNVTLSSDINPISISEANQEIRWSNAEMHDAMQTHLSDYSDHFNWAM